MKNEISKILYDMYRGNIPTKFSAMSKADRDEAIRKRLFEVFGMTEFTPDGFRRAWRKHQVDVYEIIEDTVVQVIADGEYLKNDFINKFVEVKNLKLGDTNEFYVAGKNELVVEEFSGSHFDLRRQRFDAGSTFSIAVRDYGVKVFEYWERVLSGRVSFESLVGMIAEAIDNHLSQMAEIAFGKAVEKLPAIYKYAGNYNEEAILELLAHLEASNGEKPVLVGTKMALRKLQGIVGGEWSDAMKDARNRDLILPVWNSYDCMELAQSHKIGTEDFVMPNDKIYAICGSNTKLIKMVLEGNAEVKDIAIGTEMADKSLETTVTFRAGVAFAYNKMMGEIALV